MMSTHLVNVVIYTKLHPSLNHSVPVLYNNSVSIIPTVFGKTQICIDRDTVQKKKRASRSIFVVLSTTNLKMICKQTTNKQMYLI